MNIELSSTIKYEKQNTKTALLQKNYYMLLYIFIEFITGIIPSNQNMIFRNSYRVVSNECIMEKEWKRVHKNNPNLKTGIAQIFKNVHKSEANI